MQNKIYNVKLTGGKLFNIGENVLDEDVLYVCKKNT